MRIFENAQYDFWSMRRTGVIVSSILIVVAVISLFYPGLEAGIDFKGGTELVILTEEALPPTDVRAALDAELGSGTEVKEYGSPTELRVRTTDTETGDASEQPTTAPKSAT